MINPIFESGARRRMRTVRTPVILTAYMAALLVFSLCMLTDFMGQGIRVATMRLSTEWTIWTTAFQFFLIALVAPALGAGCIAGERERQTFDLLLVTGVGTRKIVLGKLMENYLFLLLLIFSGLPVLMLANMTGGYRVVDLLVILLYLAVIALAALAVGMVMSVLFRRSLTAIIAAYLAIFAIGGGTWALALRGPLAAQYTYEFIDSLSLMDPGELLFSLPVTIYLCPPVALVMLLASQTGILHTTMHFTMRLGDIYMVASAAGFGKVSCVSIVAILAGALLLIVLSMALLHVQTDVRRREKASAQKAD